MIPFPEKKYQVIYADPPWSYKWMDNAPVLTPVKSGKNTLAPNYYYDTMGLDEIKNLPIQDISEKNCVLFLWTTNPMLREGLEVMESWGFNYITTITWYKTNSKGMGYWFRGFTEHLLFGKKGKVKSFRSMAPNIQEHKFTKHSEKPDLFRKLIEDATIGLNPKIELFSRKRYEGWDAWGDEAPDLIHTRLSVDKHRRRT